MSAPDFPEPEGRPGLQIDKTPPQVDNSAWPPASQLPPTGGPSSWLPKRWRQPIVGYVAATLLQALAILLTWLLIQPFPTFSYTLALPLLAVAFVALTWGVGPSLLALLIGVVLVDYFFLEPGLSLAVSRGDLVGLVIFLLVGLVISGLAGQNKRTRIAAETLAGSLESERARLQAIFEAIPDDVSLHDARGTMVDANPAGLQNIGQHILPVPLDKLLDLYHPHTIQSDPIPAQQLPIARALRGETLNGIELLISKEEGSEQVILAGAAPIRNRLGQIEGAVVISHDVTLLRQAEQEAIKQRRQLQALQALTHTALTHLSSDELVSELLTRLQEVMGVDAATILLLDEATQELRVHATHGMEEGITANVRIPVGQGFTGRIAASRQPLIVEDLSTFDSFHPLLKRKLRSVVGVPLMVGERVLGVAHVGMASPRHFTDVETQLLQSAADRIALALDRAALYASAEAARSEAEQRASELEAVIEAISDGVFIYGPQGETRSLNAAAYAMLGFDAQPDAARFPIQQRLALLEAYDEQSHRLSLEQFPAFRVVHGETLDSANSIDMRLRVLDGRHMQFNCIGAPIRDADGRQVGAVMVARDVTERRQLERRTEESLQALLDMAQALVEEPLGENTAERNGLAPHVVARRMVELVCRVVGCKRATFFHFEPETALFRPIAVAGFAPELEQQWLADPRQIHRLGESLTPELTERFASGEVVVIDLRQPSLSHISNPYHAQTILAAPLRIGQRLVGEFALDFGPEAHNFTPQEIALTSAVGKLAALVIERERLLREREEARTNVLALREANRRMDEFLGIASHELRTPLTKIKTSMQLAERRVKTALRQERAEDGTLIKTLQPIQEMIVRGVHSADVVNRLVGDLLDVSRIQADRLEMRPAPMNLIQVVCEAVEEQRELSPNRVITLALPDDKAALMIADADRIAQVVINYLTNALKYSPADRPVEVTVQIDQREARISVRDHGPGIPLDAQAHLWERFYQARGVTVQQGSSVGLGLGLYISRTIIERHGGQVGVESAPGEGAAFWFALPLLAGPRSST